MIFYNPDNKYYIVDKYYPHDDSNLIKYSFKELRGYKCVSAYYVLLPQMLKIPGVKNYFIEQGYSVYFESNRYILSESIFKSIYQGALGEVIGRFIIEKKMLEILNLKFESLLINPMVELILIEKSSNK